MFDRLRSLTLSHVNMICAAIYLATAAAGVLQAGFNADDWRDLGETPAKWAETEGRWGMDLLYRYALQERPQLPLQLLLAFGCFLWLSHLLAGYTSKRDNRPLAVLLIFTLGVNHVYLVDMLNFNSHVFPNTFAIVLSVLAFHLVGKINPSGSPLARTPLFLAAVQLLALALAIYQPYALAGLMIPTLLVLDVEGQSTSRLRVAFGAFMVLGASGILLYKLEEWAFLLLSDRVVAFSRFEPPTLDATLQKLARLPGMLRGTHMVWWVSVPTGFRYLMALFSLAIGVLAVVAAWREFMVRQGLQGRFLRAARLPIGVLGGMFAVPAVLWFTYAGLFVPPRILGYFGFLLASTMLAVLGTSSLPSVARRIGLTALGVASVAMSLAASKVWSDQARTARGDEELARAIYARVGALTGYRGEPFSVVGEVRYRSSPLGPGVFHLNNNNLSIFKHMYNLTWNGSVLPFSPRACPAFPADGSTFMFEGRAYVCVNAFADFLPPTECVNTGAPHHVTVCVPADQLVWMERDCMRLENEAAMVSVALTGGGRGAEFDFEPGLPHTEIGGTCYRVLKRDDVKFDTIEISARGADHSLIWTESFPAPRRE